MDEYYAEQSADEIFSGPTHELVPSSYSSFHRHHWPHHNDDEETHSIHRRGSLFSSRSTRRLSDSSRASYNSFAVEYDPDEANQFHFFSRDEISHADGASTVFGDDDSVHSSISEGSNAEAAGAEPNSGHETTQLHPHESFQGIEGDHNGEHHARTQQRYYIAEEDMRIFCAGYSVVSWRLFLWRLGCIGTLGFLFLLGRWFPRQRLYVVAREMPLKNCEFLVVENQWGELETVDVSVQPYNHPLSTCFTFISGDKDANEESAIGGEEDVGSDVRSEGGSIYVDNDPNVSELRIFIYRYVRFLYHPVEDMFLTNSGWATPQWATLESAICGLDGEVHARREQVFGKNSLEIAQPGLLKLLMDEVLHPFYVFQAFSVVLWLMDEYLYYAFAILLISVMSVGQALVETRQGMKRLADIAHQAMECEIHVLRSGFWRTIPCDELVPGDVYELSDPALTTVPVDSLLLTGDCIVNESILTGESVPVGKLPCTDESLARYVQLLSTHVADALEGANGYAATNATSAVGRNAIYSGTKIIRVRKPEENDSFEPALAMAVRTGFNTTKGALVRSMMFPKPSGFKFYRDSFRYIGVMACVAMVGFIFSTVNFVRLGMPTSLIVLRALDLITVVVPPALPATLTIGTNFSLQRLRRKNIFCITPSRVNVAGRVNAAVFDKTGTLTEEGLDVLGVHLVYHNEDQNKLKFGKLLHTAEELASQEDEVLLDTLVTCHELRLVDESVVGDPLDVKMFEFTGWDYDEKRRRFVPPQNHTKHSQNNTVLHVYKQFEFTPQLRRMSVVASAPYTSGTRLLAKGAPEIMESICKPETLPANFNDVLHEYTHRGYRVIACAWRDIGDISDYDRKELEQGLTFAGLIVFENKLKPESRPALETLGAAGIRSVMCTGDNVLTALSVGRECSIVPKAPVFAAHFDEFGELEWEGLDNPQHKLDSQTLRPLQSGTSSKYSLAVTGDVFSYLVERGSYEALEQMLARGVVFARMSPDEKHELVSRLQHIGYTTLFCGDGANDCGALKAADVGVSLSEAEASVAAPFTSKRFDISCVLDVLAEGRCALTTSFGCFKYMSMYSAIQFVTVTILYSYGTNIGDFQFLYIDLFLIVPIAAFMAWSSPSPILAKKRPNAELVSHKVLVPLLSYMVLVAIVQVLAWQFVHLTDWPWYILPIPGNNDDLRSSDNTVLFYVSSFQYILYGIVFCDGLPFRLPVSTNKPFILTVLIASAITTLFMLVSPDSFVGDLMDLTWTPYWFSLVVVAFITLNWLGVKFLEGYMFGPLSRIFNREKSVPRYKELLEHSSV